MISPSRSNIILPPIKFLLCDPISPEVDQSHRLGLPAEIWLKIFTLLNPLQISWARLVCKTWRILTADKSLWKLFQLSFSSSISLIDQLQIPLHTHILMHAYWSQTKDLKLVSVATVPWDHQLIGFINSRECVIKSNNGLLTCLSLSSRQRSLCFPYRVEQVKVLDHAVAVIFSDNLGIGLYLSGETSLFYTKEEHTFICRSPRVSTCMNQLGALTRTIEEEHATQNQSLYLNQRGEVFLLEEDLPLKIANEEDPSPLIYNIFTEHSLFVLGYSFGLVKGVEARTGRLIFEYQDPSKRSVQSINLVEPYILISYPSLTSPYCRNDIILLNQETGQLVSTFEDIDYCLSFPDSLIYSHPSGDIFKVDFDAVSMPKRIVYAEHERGSYPSHNSIVRAHLVADRLVCIYSNGKIYAHDSTNRGTSLIHETLSRGVSPHVFEEHFEVYGNFLTARIDEDMHIFSLPTLQRICSTKGEKAFLLGNQLAIQNTDTDYIELITLERRDRISFAPHLIDECFHFGDFTFLVTKQGSLIRLNGVTPCPVYQFPQPLLKVQLIGERLICVMEEREQIQDHVHIVCLKLSLNGECQLLGEFSLPYPQETQEEEEVCSWDEIIGIDDEGHAVEEMFQDPIPRVRSPQPTKKRFVTCMGIQLRGFIILIVGKKLTTINSETGECTSCRDLSKEAFKIVKKCQGFFVLIHSNNEESLYLFDPSATDPIRYLSASAFPQEVQFFHQRYLMEKLSDGTQLSFDCHTKRKVRFTMPQYPTTPSWSEPKQEIVEFKDKNLLVLIEGEIVKVVCLQTGDVSQINEERLSKWFSLEENLWLIFQTGRVMMLDRISGNVREISQLADPSQIDYTYQKEYVVLYCYYGNKTQVVHYHSLTDEKLTWDLNLPDRPSGCFLIHHGQSILIEFVEEDIDGYPSYHYGLLNCHEEQELVRLDLQLTHPLQEVLWENRNILLLKTRSDIYAYHLKTKILTDLFPTDFKRDIEICILKENRWGPMPQFLIEFLYPYDSDGSLDYETWYRFDYNLLTLSKIDTQTDEKYFNNDGYDSDGYRVTSKLTSTLTFDNKKFVWEGRVCHIWEGEECILSKDFSDQLDSEIASVSNFANKIFIKTVSSKLYFCDFSRLHDQEVTSIADECEDFTIVYNTLIVFGRNTTTFFQLTTAQIERVENVSRSNREE